MKRSLVSGVGVILCAVGLARASIEVKQYDASGTQVGSTSTYSSGAAFSITIGSTDVRTIAAGSSCAGRSLGR